MPNASTTNTGFVSLGQYLNANRDALAREAADYTNPAIQQAQNAEAQDKSVKTLADYSAAQQATGNAQDAINSLSNQVNQTNYIANKDATDTPGGRSLDQAMFGAAVSPAVGQAQSAYGNLQSYLGSPPAAPAKPTKPGRPDVPEGAGDPKIPSPLGGLPGHDPNDFGGVGAAGQWSGTGFLPLPGSHTFGF